MKKLEGGIVRKTLAVSPCYVLKADCERRQEVG